MDINLNSYHNVSARIYKDIEEADRLAMQCPYCDTDTTITTMVCPDCGSGLNLHLSN